MSCFLGQKAEADELTRRRSRQPCGAACVYIARWAIGRRPRRQSGTNRWMGREPRSRCTESLRDWELAKTNRPPEKVALLPLMEVSYDP